MKRLMLILSLIVFNGCTCHTVEPGNRGVLVDFGKVQPDVYKEGMYRECFGCDYFDVSIRQQKKELAAPCFTGDMQQVNLSIAILYRIPESAVITIYKDYHGEPFDVLIQPRALEAIKEATAKRTAKEMAKDREAVKTEALATLRKKVGDTLVIEDLIITDIALSKDLEAAIEQTMVREQESAKAQYSLVLAQKNAEIAKAQADGEANAIRSRAQAEADSINMQGEALRKNPEVLKLRLIEKWSGVSPQVVSGASDGTTLLLPALGGKP